MQALPDWFTIESRLGRGETAYEVQRGIADSLRPRLRLSKPWRSHIIDEVQKNTKPERLRDFFSREMSSGDWPSASQVLSYWREDTPARADHELLNELTTELERAIREAEEAELIDGYIDCSDQDVRSISYHQQDEHSSGFYPVIRLMADLWERLSQKHPQAARRIADKWAESRYLLPRRLALHASLTRLYWRRSRKAGPRREAPRCISPEHGARR